MDKVRFYGPVGASRDALRAVFEAQPDPVLVTSPAGRVLDMNSAGVTFLGADALGDLVDRSILEFISDGDQQRYRAWHDAAVRGDPAPDLLEVRFEAGPARPRIARCHFAPLRSPEGDVAAVLSIVRDVTEQHRAETALLDRERELANFIDISSATFWTATPDGAITIATDAAAARMGIPKQLPDGRTRAAAIHPDDVPRVREAWHASLESGLPFDSEYRLCVADGTYHWVHARAYARRSASGVIERWYGSTEDVDGRKQAEQRLIESEALNRTIVESSADCIKLLNAEGRLVFMNRRGLASLEIESFESIKGRDWASIWPQEARETVQRALSRAREKGHDEFTAACPTMKGELRWWNVVVTPTCSAAGLVTGFVAISRDVTERRRSEERMRWMATHDSLTGLPNRTFLQEEVAAGLAAAQPFGAKLGMILLDIDRFKEVNDDLGHDVGDAVLQAVAARLSKLGPPVRCVGRLGGDEFVVLVTGLSTASELEAVAEELVAHLHDPIEHAGKRLRSRGSFGLALSPCHGTTYSELLKSADIALYMAKTLGRGGYTVYDPLMQRAMQQRLAVAERVRSSLSSDIFPFYQPKLNLTTGGLDGFEALMRIRTANGRMEGPGAISSAFEDFELAHLLSERMIERVVADMQRWLDRGIAFGRVALNAGAPELRHDGFAHRLLERLEKGGVPASLLEVEITETVLLGHDVGIIDEALRTLSGRGVRIALDDFGTGYSSLSHVKRYPVDTLKIDRSFVQGLGRSRDDEAIVRALIALARSLGLTVVGEGIETAEQAVFLAREGCDSGQGYLLGRPMSAARVPAFIAGLQPARDVQHAAMGAASVERLRARLPG